MKEKGSVQVLILFGILILIITAIGVYYFKPQTSKSLTQNQTIAPQTSQSAQTLPTLPSKISNWKTYKNTTYSFQVKYPDNLIAKEHSSGVNFELKNYPNKVEFPAFVGIEIYKNPENLNTADFIQKNIATIIEGTNIQQVKINNLNGIRLGLSGPTDNDNVAFEHGGYIYIITLGHGLIESADISTEIFNQILSTFELTD